MLLSVQESCGLVVGVWDPDDEVLARRYQHAINVAELYSGNCSRVEVQKLHLVSCFNVPYYDLLFLSFTSCDQVSAVRRETCLQDAACTEFVEGSSELVFQFALERVDEDDHVLSCTQHDKLTIW